VPRRSAVVGAIMPLQAGMLGLARATRTCCKEGYNRELGLPALIDTGTGCAQTRGPSNLIPIGRFGTAEEVASIVLMLAENAYITAKP